MDAQEDMTFSEHLPRTTEQTRRNVRALKMVQLRYYQVETAFFKRLHQLEMEFQPQFNKINEERRAVVSGMKVPTEDECVPKLLHGADKKDLDRLESEWNKDNPTVKDERGIPEFWLQTLMNFGPTAEMITEEDMFVLMYLADITVETHSDPRPKFTLNFHFDPNDYFTNTVLQKHYLMSLDIDEEFPFDYEGPSVVHTLGTTINWKDNMNITKRVIRKTLRNSRTGETKKDSKTVKTDSFFNYFDASPTYEFDIENKAVHDLLVADYEIGTLIRDQLVPRAVLYYTGELTDSTIEQHLEVDSEEHTDDCSVMEIHD